MALGFFSRLKEGLSRSTQKLTESIGSVLTKRTLDEAALSELEDALGELELEQRVEAARLAHQAQLDRHEAEARARALQASAPGPRAGPPVPPTHLTPPQGARRRRRRRRRRRGAGWNVAGAKLRRRGAGRGWEGRANRWRRPPLFHAWGRGAERPRWVTVRPDPSH